MVELRIIDPCAPRGYDTAESLRGLGGTEATVIKIAQALATDHAVTIEQAARHESGRVAGICFRPMDLGTGRGEIIVVINAWKVALKLRRANPHARILVWLHNFPGRHNRQMGQQLREAGIEVICVSHSHARALQAFLPVQPRIGHIYNPIADDLRPDTTPRDPNRLIFASSPHKGLRQVISQFAAVRRALPDLTLIVANPGYMIWPAPALCAGIILRGALGHASLIDEFRRALCLFYPQSEFAETFGLVIAEANAVGCPALLHGPSGANREIASGGAQCLDEVEPEALIARLSQWRVSPPSVDARPEFRLVAVADVWRELLGGAGRFLPGELSAINDLRQKQRVGA